MWRLRIEDDQAQRTVVDMVRDEYTIGRTEDADVSLAERNISRKHARITLVEKQWILQDLDSENGTGLNGEKVEGSIPLDHGDRLYLGDYVIELIDETRAPPEVPVSSEDETTRHAARPGLSNKDRLAVIEGPGRGTLFALTKRQLFIGRGDECDIELADTSVSRVHARIERVEDGRHLITDENSSNGIRINGIDVPSMLLDVGDIVELGDVFLQYVPRGERFDPNFSIEPDTGASRASVTANRRALGAVLGAAAMAGGLVYLMRPSPELSREEAVASAPMSSTQLMQSAKKNIERGDVETAIEYLRRIPTASELTASDDYQRIAAAWADFRLEQSRTVNKPQVQHALIESIANADFVDSGRRKAARLLLRTLDHESESRATSSEAGRTFHQLAKADAGLSPATDPEEVVTSPGIQSPPMAKSGDKAGLQREADNADQTEPGEPKRQQPARKASIAVQKKRKRPSTPRLGSSQPPPKQRLLKKNPFLESASSDSPRARPTANTTKPAQDAPTSSKSSAKSATPTRTTDAPRAEASPAPEQAPAKTRQTSQEESSPQNSPLPKSAPPEYSAPSPPQDGTPPLTQ